MSTSRRANGTAFEIAVSTRWACGNQPRAKCVSTHAGGTGSSAAATAVTTTSAAAILRPHGRHHNRWAGRGSGIPDINAPGGTQLRVQPDDGRRIEIRGIVQGVGFRPWVYRLAGTHGVGGWVRNDAGGVTIEAFGPARPSTPSSPRCRRLPRPPRGSSSSAAARFEGEPASAFGIVASEPSADRRVSIPADLATCADCLRRGRDPADRRYRYPFTNCTNCGPRFTIAIDVPYDRPNTTMAPFAMCPACRAEYESPADRRFHAQPNACPACGPRLWLADADGRELASADPIAAAAEAIGRRIDRRRQGPRRLPPRLRRDQRGGRRRTATAQAARREAVRRDGRRISPAPKRLRCLDADERLLLLSVERPIVLARRRAAAGLAPNVAPGNPLVGADAALHAAPPPAARRRRPAARDDVGQPLGRAARVPERRGARAARPASPTSSCCTTARSTRAATTRWPASSPARRSSLRRSRGYVPARHRVARTLRAARARVRRAAEEHVLPRRRRHGVPRPAHRRPREPRDLRVLRARHRADGALPRRRAGRHRARPAPGVPVDPLRARAARAVQGGRPAPPRPRRVPPWPSTASRARHRRRLRRHRARHRRHRVGRRRSCVADVHAASSGSATFRPIRLAGGDLAIRQVWRQALALLDDAFGGDRAARAGSRSLARSCSRGSSPSSARCSPPGVNASPAHGVGRYFDAVGALGLGRAESRFEGQVALEWNLAADPARRWRSTRSTIDAGTAPGRGRPAAGGPARWPAN